MKKKILAEIHRRMLELKRQYPSGHEYPYKLSIRYQELKSLRKFITKLK